MIAKLGVFFSKNDDLCQDDCIEGQYEGDDDASEDYGKMEEG